MKANARSTLLTKSVTIQIVVSALLWLSLALYLYKYRANWDPKVSIASFVAIPAAVIAIAQLVITAQVQRASYTRDYLIRFRTDKELSESFRYLIYRFDNRSYEISQYADAVDTHQVALADRNEKSLNKLWPWPLAPLAG